MKRYIHYIVLLAAFLVGATACESESMPAAFPGDYSFSLNTNTRAKTDGNTPQENGVDDWNENKLDFVYLFFFDGNNSLKYKTEKILVGSDQKVSFSVTRQELTENAAYTVYALANRELTTEVWNGITSIADLNALSVPAISVENDGKQSSFVMSGQASITSLTKGDNGSINLYRSAAKISLVLDVVDKIEVVTGEKTITYEPVLTSMKVTLHKGAKDGVVDGMADFAELTGTIRDISEKQEVEGVSVANHVPFYSYPTSWVDNEDNECYLELMIIWKNKDSGAFAPYYYRIPVNKDTKKLLRNHHYKISTEVARLGSLKESDAKELTATFDIEDWNECSLYPNLKKYSYLWVEDTDIIMNNSNQITINFASSSAVEVTLNSVKRDNPQGNNYAEDDNHDVSYNNIVNVSSNNETGKITVNVNRRTDTADNNYKDNYRPWRITLTVTNTDGISQDVTVEHRPAIYVIGNFNSNGHVNRFVYGTTGGSTNLNGYGTSVNSDDNKYSLGSLYNISNVSNTASNRNKNQYKIYISVLGKEYEDYYIGDPRTSTSVSLSYMNKYDNSGGKLDNYHPTDENAMDVIAPSFIISSSWALTYPMNSYNNGGFEGAKRRCASYQENGYPAGRWRLPTLAEIEFVMSLSDKDYIPVLFAGRYYTGDGDYYTSEGYNGNSIGVRCVYDLWFWGDDAPLTGTAANTFTWGDQAY